MIPPRIPGTAQRFVEPDPSLYPYIEALRTEVQEGAPGLWIFQLPGKTMAGTPLFSVVEAYYPEDIRPATFESILDPYRREDHKAGRLVSVGTLGLQGFSQIGEGMGAIYATLWLLPPHIEEIRRNNRAARRELKRQGTASYLAKDIHARREQEEQEVYNDWVDAYEQGFRDSLDFAMGKPRVNVPGQIS